MVHPHCVTWLEIGECASSTVVVFRLSFLVGQQFLVSVVRLVSVVATVWQWWVKGS